jgi:hypothetical protein
MNLLRGIFEIRHSGQGRHRVWYQQNVCASASASFNLSTLVHPNPNTRANRLVRNAAVPAQPSFETQNARILVRASVDKIERLEDDWKWRARNNAPWIWDWFDKEERLWLRRIPSLDDGV